MWPYYWSILMTMVSPHTAVRYLFTLFFTRYGPFPTVLLIKHVPCPIVSVIINPNFQFVDISSPLGPFLYIKTISPISILSFISTIPFTGNFLYFSKLLFLYLITLVTPLKAWRFLFLYHPGFYLSQNLIIYGQVPIARL